MIVLTVTEGKKTKNNLFTQSKSLIDQNFEMVFMNDKKYFFITSETMHASYDEQSE